MNLLMYYDKVDTELFKTQIKKLQVLKYYHKFYHLFNANLKMVYWETEEDNKTTNNIIEIKNGSYMRGQLDKGSLGSGSKDLIQTIFNDFGHGLEQSLLIIYNQLLQNI